MGGGPVYNFYNGFPPQPSAPFVSLNAAAAVEVGAQVNFSAGVSRLAMQVSWTGAPTSAVVSLQGSIDGVNWDTLTDQNNNPVTVNGGTGGTQLSGAIVATNTTPIIAARANLTTLAGGTSPTVTATILPAA